MSKDIKEYWNERASSSDGKKATTDDIWLRELEIRIMVESLRQLKLPHKASVLDAGCGDGYSTIKIAEEFPEISFHGIDFSENMIKAASSLLEKKQIKNVTFSVCSVLDLEKIFEVKFDAVMTDSCLINLNKPEMQKEALSSIAAVTKDGGHYIGIENFNEGQTEMNNARKKIGLPEIPIRWHNLFFSENDFKKMIADKFDLVWLKDFSSSYYFATRVVYSKM